MGNRAINLPTCSIVPQPCYRVPLYYPSSEVKVIVKVTLRLAVYCQSVPLGVKPLETHEYRNFPSEPLR
jgi:hypothetical protein